MLEGAFGKKWDNSQAALFLNNLFAKVGQSLREFHEGGIVRFPAHFGNFTLGAERVIFHDLGAVLRADKLSLQQRLVYQLIDLAYVSTSIHGLALRSKWGHKLLDYWTIQGEEEGGKVAISESPAVSPHSFFLAGYFGENTDKRESLFQVADDLNNLFKRAENPENMKQFERQLYFAQAAAINGLFSVMVDLAAPSLKGFYRLSDLNKAFSNRRTIQKT